MNWTPTQINQSQRKPSNKMFRVGIKYKLMYAIMDIALPTNAYTMFCLVMITKIILVDQWNTFTHAL